MTKDTEDFIREDLREMLIDTIDNRRFDNDYPVKMMYKDISYVVNVLLDTVLREKKRAELYGRLHETIEAFQSGIYTAEKYSERHAEIMNRLDKETK